MRQRNGLGNGMIQSMQGLRGGGHGTTKEVTLPLPDQEGECGLQFHCSWVGGGADGLAGSLLDAEVPRGKDLVQCQIKLGFPGRAELRKVLWWR